jgi:hypothetical protein
MITKLIGEGHQSTYRSVNTDSAESTPGNAVVIAQPPEESGDRIWVLDAIQYSYKKQTDATSQAAPVTGRLTIRLDDKIKWDADIPDLTGVLNLYIPGQTDKTFSVTLGPGGNGVVGKLNVQWHLEPAV